MELTGRLYKHLVVVRNYKKFHPLSFRREKERLKGVSNEISDNLVLRRAAFMQGKLGVLNDLKTLIDGMQLSKGGRPTSRVSAATGLFLAELFYEATGKAPGHKSGVNFGPFHRFVTAAVGTNMNAGTVTKKGVNLWKDQRNNTSSQKTTFENLPIYKALANKNK